MAGRDIRDPHSVDAPLEGAPPARLRAALVTQLPGAPLDASIIAAVRRAGALLRAAGWDVEETAPPEIARVNDIFNKLLGADLAVIAPQSRPFISDGLFGLLTRLHQAANLGEMSTYRVHIERSRLLRAWSGFFAEYPVVIGPNWGRAFWRIDSDLDPVHGVELLAETVRFITPGNVLGIPSLSAPMGLHAGLPTGIQIYADLWREDLCLRAAEVIEAGVKLLSPVEVSSAFG